MSGVLFRGSRLIARKMGFELKAANTAPDNRIAYESLVQFRDSFSTLTGIEQEFMKFCAERVPRSRAQLFQDLFALYQTDEKRGGFFVEFGATNGVSLSNTYLLETEYGWSGILAEPARAWHEDLKNNRQCVVDTRCVTDKTGETLVFNETEWLELSTIENYSKSDYHSSSRRGAKQYEVATISLNDLLKEHSAPKDIDFMSVDTEGSELMILSALDFDAYCPRVITVEHNYTPARNGLFDLLTSKGYRRIFSEISQFDDWYIVS